MDWYRTMERMYDEGPDPDGIPLGQASITRRIAWTFVAMLALIFANHFIRLETGRISWLGVTEVNARAAPDWMHTPVSTNVIAESFGLSLPVAAGPGDEIVVSYSLNAQDSSTSAPRTKIVVTCLCPTKNWHIQQIESPGTGSLTFPVTDRDFYTVNLHQSPGAQGRNSIGTYWWGLRRTQSQ